MRRRKLMQARPLLRMLLLPMPMLQARRVLWAGPPLLLPLPPTLPQLPLPLPLPYRFPLSVYRRSAVQSP